MLSSSSRSLLLESRELCILHVYYWHQNFFDVLADVSLLDAKLDVRGHGEGTLDPWHLVVVVDAHQVLGHQPPAGEEACSHIGKHQIAQILTRAAAATKAKPEDGPLVSKFIDIFKAFRHEL